MLAGFIEPIKLHLNENLSPRLAIQLRTYNLDVTSSQELGMLSDPDDKQLAYAAANERAIVTLNVSDFMELHHNYIAEGREHWGIIFSTEQPIGEFLRRLVRLTSTITAEELRNQTRWLNEFK